MSYNQVGLYYFVMTLFKSTCFSTCTLLFRQISLSAFMLRLDYYKVLGVTKNASSEEIKKAYLKKCKEYHPDKHMGSKTMQEKFVEANQAYNVLSDDKKKKEYDAKFKTVNKASGYQTHSAYRWGNEPRTPRANPDDVFREYQRHASQHRFRGRHRNSQDPFYQHWHNIYENFDSKRDPGAFSRKDAYQASGFRRPYEEQEEFNDLNVNARNVVILFFFFLLLVLYVRVKIASKSMQHSFPDPNHNPQRPYNHPSNKPKSAIDDLNVKTEDA